MRIREVSVRIMKKQLRENITRASAGSRPIAFPRAASRRDENEVDASWRSRPRKAPDGIFPVRS
jgi:hypothetical protein